MHCAYTNNGKVGDTKHQFRFMFQNCYSSVADPLDPGSVSKIGMGKKFESGIRMNIPDHIYESL
jgi:hypothetical protein